MGKGLSNGKASMDVREVRRAASGGGIRCRLRIGSGNAGARRRRRGVGGGGGEGWGVGFWDGRAEGRRWGDEGFGRL